MKECMKVSDVFDLPVKPSHVHDENGYGFKLLLLHSIQSECAAHAINSHDELVSEVERLRGIIERVISTSKELSLRSPTTQWGDGYKECALATAHALEDMIK